MVILLLIAIFQPVDAQNSKITALIKDVNEWCEKYDLYKRVFSYNENTKLLTMVNENCTVKVPANKISAIYVQRSDENFMVVFSTKGNEKCIEINCTGYTQKDSLTGVTMTDQKYAEKVAANLNKVVELVSSDNGKSKSSGKIDKASSNLLTEINNLCAKYDKYHRVFTIDKNNKLLVFTSEYCVVKLPFLKIDKVEVTDGKGTYSLSFSSKKLEKCFDVKCTSFSEMDNLTSLTFIDRDGAEKAAEKLHQLIELNR